VTESPCPAAAKSPARSVADEHNERQRIINMRLVETPEKRKKRLDDNRKRR